MIFWQSQKNSKMEECKTKRNKRRELTIREHLRGPRSCQCRQSLRSWRRFRWGIRTRGPLPQGRCSTCGSPQGGRGGWRSQRWTLHRGRGKRNRSLLLGNTKKGYVSEEFGRRNQSRTAVRSRREISWVGAQSFRCRNVDLEGYVVMMK